MKKLPILKILTLIAALSISAIGANAFALDETWGPQDRPTYTWDVPADKPTFNSIIDNPYLGEEMNFVRVREATSTEPYEDYVDIEVGKEYEVYVYYHNNASPSLNASGVGLAQNVRLKTELPSELHDGDTAVIKGTIEWGTDEKSEVWDTAFLRAHDTVYLRYVENSATIHNDGNANGTILDANALFGNGALLAYNTAAWGVIPGCDVFAGYVTYRIKVDQPKFYMEKEVTKSGEDNWNDTITVKPGDKLDFRITYTNYGTTEQTSVKVRDILPEGLTYVEDSTIAVTPAVPDGVKVADKIFNEGLVIGNYQPGEKATITYSVIVGEESEFIECTTIIYNDAHAATANGTQYDKVKITVEKDCEEPPAPTPSELPNTGPVEIAMAIIIVIGIGIGGFYLFRTKRTLSRVKKDVSGKKHNTDDTELKTPNNGEEENHNHESEKLNEKPDDDKSVDKSDKTDK